MILRSLMDAWPRFHGCFEGWKATLFNGGLDSRAQDTYGTLLALANLLLGDDGMEAAGFHVEDPDFVGQNDRRNDGERSPGR